MTIIPYATNILNAALWLHSCVERQSWSLTSLRRYPLPVSFGRKGLLSLYVDKVMHSTNDSRGTLKIFKGSPAFLKRKWAVLRHLLQYSTALILYPGRQQESPNAANTLSVGTLLAWICQAFKKDFRRALLAGRNFLSIVLQHCLILPGIIFIMETV